MQPLSDESKKYMQNLAERKKQTRVTKEYQLVGLEVADILEDRPHKGLYIRLTKQFGKDRMLTLAKSVAEKKDVKNRGAYFMKLIYSEDK